MREEPRNLGLRLQIVLALAGVMLVAYVPLFFAIAQIMRGTSIAVREDAARSLGRAVAAHVGAVQKATPAMLEQTIASHLGEGGAVAIAVFDANGAWVAGEHVPAPQRPYGESARAVRDAFEFVLPGMPDGAVLVRVRTEHDAARTAQLVRGIALYMTIFALALLVFAYIALTRLIVRPIEQLARAADRIATGARTLELPHSGAREIWGLGASMRSMTAKLLSEESALRSKIEELTTTTRHLGETREQLTTSEHMASVGRLAAGVAHEIGNPIAAIMGMHDLLDDAETDTAAREDFLRRMRKETERIHVVVRDLLDYARPEEGTRPESADVAEVVDDVLRLVRPQKHFKGIAITTDVAAGAKVVLRPQRLTQVLLNLLLNAGAALAGTGQIRLRARRSGKKVRIEIEDDGPGVPPDLLSRIFDPFVTTKDVGEGTGLGLAVCRGIIEGANGALFVDTAYPEGARFVIELPAAS
jgi:two-component system, NtrC family, sensor kinase